MHLGDSLMKHMVHTTQEVFSKRNAFTTSQMSSHYNVIQSGFIGFMKDRYGEPERGGVNGSR
jgi:hypothetical protein